MKKRTYVWSVSYTHLIEEMPGYDEISEELLHSARAIIEADNEMQRIKDKIGMFLALIHIFQKLEDNTWNPEAEN